LGFPVKTFSDSGNMFGRSGSELFKPDMKPADKALVILRQPLLPLILIVVINATAFFLFNRVGSLVGADLGTDTYKEIAENLVRGNGFVSSPGKPSTMMSGYMKREPVYPLLLSGILSVTGELTPVVLCLVQTLLCVLSCYLLYRLAARVFEERTARIVCFIYALHPISFWYTSRFASEMIAVPVLLLSLLAVERFFRKFMGLAALQVGLLLGVAALTKSAYVILLPLVLLFAAVRSRQKVSQFLVAGLIVVSSFAGVHSLWLVRNYTISGEIVPFTTMNGVIFFVGNGIVEQFDVKRLTAGGEPERSADTLYRSVQADIASKQHDLSLPRLEAQTDRELGKMARQLVLTKPAFFVRKVLTGIIFIWFVSDSTAKSLGWGAFQVPLLVLAIVGIYRQRKWSLTTQFLLVFAVVFLLAYAMVSPYARYAAPVAVVLMLFASSGLRIALEWLRWPIGAAA
jgi:4-amino-4-deoxy-L-arabinose transferase-like glycosyltransferase